MAIERPRKACDVYYYNFYGRDISVFVIQMNELLLISEKQEIRFSIRIATVYVLNPNW